MRGRPILGGISGFLFGVFLAVALQQWSIRPLDNLSVFGLPLLGIALGLASAYWAPFGRATAASPQPAPDEVVSSSPADVPTDEDL